ncbi:mitochondrial import inner membrane translocase subunit TIM50, putative [Plasmodium gaboni]|uniref:Mitochondrial import inner membrane translocase subunit TIM50 n=1 Tax=Plasmodium gaboni TaxID=647221 RepID=A0ABY1UKL2_9APIC|nr:mitochondrial import inner membrane translocase subunit TIM50, putative [Plasmodium gaboni]
MNTLLRLKGLYNNKHKICNNVLRKCCSIKGSITKSDIEAVLDENLFYENEEGKKGNLENCYVIKNMNNRNIGFECRRDIFDSMSPIDMGYMNKLNNDNKKNILPSNDVHYVNEKMKSNLLEHTNKKYNLLNNIFNFKTYKVGGSESFNMLENMRNYKYFSSSVGFNNNRMRVKDKMGTNMDGVSARCEIKYNNIENKKMDINNHNNNNNMRKNYVNNNKLSGCFINNKESKTLKEIYMDKKEKEKLIKMYLLLSLLLMPFGYVYMYCIENDITVEEFIKMMKKKGEILENKYNDLLNEFIDRYFPLSSEPLLPDFKDLNYPENLPTLVIDLNYVIAKLEYDRKTGWRVLKRPYADRFFKELSSFYEIVIWSDDNFPVAQEVISKWGIPAIGCLHRDQCSKKKKSYVKDLKRLGRNLDRVVMIDHDPKAFMLQPDNGILIKEFHGDLNDKEMLCLIDLLKSFAISSYDISHFLKKHGGGDYNIGKRYLQQKSDTEQKSQRIRNIGKIFHLDNKKSPNGISLNS